MSKKGSRMPSGPWSRLKPAEQDPLASVGLPSKGDKRLLDFKAQEKYYTQIIQRYMTFCTDAGKGDELLRRFKALELGESAGPSSEKEPATRPSLEALQSPANTRALSDVMMALRKLREGIVASKRADDFSIQAYLFCIRLSVLVKHPESYHPAILHLLKYLSPRWTLTPVEYREVVGYLVLDTACRRKEFSEAFSIRNGYGIKDTKIDTILSALVHDDYVKFHKVKVSVDGHRARILEYAEDDMRMQALKAFGRTYMSVDLDFLEAMTDSNWDDLVKKDGVGWERDDKKVVIRKVRAK